MLRVTRARTDRSPEFGECSRGWCCRPQVPYLVRVLCMCVPLCVGRCPSPRSFYPVSVSLIYFYFIALTLLLKAEPLNWVRTRSKRKGQFLWRRVGDLRCGAEAEAEGLTLLVADNKTGYFGVHLVKPGQPKPYQAKVRRGGKVVHLGSFATAEEAAV